MAAKLEASRGTSTAEHDRARKKLESYLKRRMRINISDGRVIDGLFLCTDNACNIVLANCEEFLSQEEVDEYESTSRKTGTLLKQPRTLSLAIIPGEHILSIALAREQENSAPIKTRDQESGADSTRDQESGADSTRDQESGADRDQKGGTDTRYQQETNTDRENSVSREQETSANNITNIDVSKDEPQPSI